MRRVIEIAMAASGLVVFGSIAAAAAQSKRASPPAQEFACYMDDKLTERHVGVASAEEKVSGPAWKITYVEGGYAIYAQREGESCQLEAVKK